MTEKIGVFAPAYYKDFKCIADKCRHSCCIDWEIRIDKETLEKYKSIDRIMKTVSEDGEDACFELCRDGRCPHLNDCGLCNIIINHGEEYLSEICRNHPRFFNRAGGHIEAGLGIVCEEACRLVLDDNRPFSLEKIEEIEENGTACDFDPLTYRNKIMSQIEEDGKSFDEKLSALKTEFEIPEIHTKDEWLRRCLSLEILDPDWENLLCNARSKEAFPCPQFDKYFVRLLSYFVYRHASTANSLVNLRARLAFAILSVEIIRYIFDTEQEKSLANLINIARMYSAEIEYSEDNTFELMFELERRIYDIIK